MRGTNRTIWVVVGVCLVVGAVIGRLLYAWATVGNLAALLGWIMIVAFAGALILFVGIGGIIAASVDRNVGTALVVGGVAVGVGATLAGVYGEGIRIVSERDARVEVTLDAPINESFFGNGTCYTVANAGTIRRIQSDAFVDVGRDRLSISIEIDDDGPLVHHRVVFGDERVGRYRSRTAVDVDVEADGERLRGVVRFDGVTSDGPDEPGAPEELAGTAQWTCNED